MRRARDHRHRPAFRETVWRIVFGEVGIPTGDYFKTVVNFDGADGARPLSPLVKAINVSFYGTTFQGGANGVGTVFKLSPEGTLTTLHSFHGSGGADPYAGLIQATDGNFYGTTQSGGVSGAGTVFKLSPEGTLTTLHSFCSQPGCADGYQPYAGLVQAPGGRFWGTIAYGGANDDGTVFVLDVGLGPFVETLPISGTVGTPVTLVGFEMKGATSATFNGTPAPFQVISAHDIKTTVPSGATTGPVTVTTPSRTLTSNVNFLVN